MRPEIPHVKGLREVLRGHRPYFSLSINSLIGIESGGAGFTEG